MRKLGLVMLVVAAAFPLAAQVPASLSDSAFGALSAELSEPSGFFDTDNLVSNEDSYLHAITTLQKLRVRGGAYLGVGPDQNFSYIAAVRPAIAFIVDIRRDNLLELLLFKSVFSLARNRAEYLSLLFGKAAPGDTTGWTARSPEQIFRYLDRAPSDSAAALSRVLGEARRSGLTLSARDLRTISRFHRTFITAGPGLRLTSFNRPERDDYPDFRSLVLQTDLSGRQASYLASEPAFRAVKDLQDRNLVVPLVGNFAGSKALRAVGGYLKARGMTVSMFYTSNVEQYLVGDGLLDDFARNLTALPRDSSSVIVRSYFPYGRSHPQHVAGYLSVQLVQRMERFLVDRFLIDRPRGGDTYYQLVTEDLVDPR